MSPLTRAIAYATVVSAGLLLGVAAAMVVAAILDGFV